MPRKARSRTCKSPTAGVRTTEADFQASVVELARLHGWRVAAVRRVAVRRPDGSFYHETPMGADGVGWPDLYLVRGRQAVAAELKSDTGRATPDQLAWLGFLEAAGVAVYIWRPKDWDEIQTVLGG